MMTVTALNVDTRRKLDGVVWSSAAKVIDAIGGDETGRGVYYRLYFAHNWPARLGQVMPLYDCWVGGNLTTNIDRIEKYKLFSVEKAVRTIQSGKASSWQTRDPENDKYGGAFVVRGIVPELGRAVVHLVHSVSGLNSEAGDEAVSLLVAKRMSWEAYPHDTEDVMRLSRNIVAERLLETA